MTPRPLDRAGSARTAGLAEIRPADATMRDGAILRQLDGPVLRRPVGLDQANVEIELALRDRRAKIDGEGERIAGPLRMLDQRAQDRGGGGAAEWADERPVIVAGPSLPAAVSGGHPRGVVEQVLGLGMHEILRIL